MIVVIVQFLDKDFGWFDSKCWKYKTESGETISHVDARRAIVNARYDFKLIFN